MNRRFTLLLGVLFFGVVLVGLYRARDRDASRTPHLAPHAESPTRSTGAAGSARSDSPSVPLARPVAVPEHLQNPHALAPEPLKLRFAGPPFDRQKDGRIHKRDVMKRATELNHPDHEAEEDLHILRSLVRSYRDIFQENPVAGENWEVVAALTGRNLYQLVFLNPSHPAINDKRELVDRWGTPFRFHPLSGTRMEFSSAGPDRQFGTGDDVGVDAPGKLGGSNLRAGS